MQSGQPGSRRDQVNQDLCYSIEQYTIVQYTIQYTTTPTTTTTTNNNNNNTNDKHDTNTDADLVGLRFEGLVGGLES